MNGNIDVVKASLKTTCL